MDSNLEPHACEVTVLHPVLLSLLALTSSPCCVEKLSRNYAQNKFARPQLSAKMAEIHSRVLLLLLTQC